MNIDKAANLANVFTAGISDRVPVAKKKSTLDVYYI